MEESRSPLMPDNDPTDQELEDVLKGLDEKIRAEDELLIIKRERDYHESFKTAYNMFADYFYSS
jgi:hypothetical protein